MRYANQERDGAFSFLDSMPYALCSMPTKEGSGREIKQSVNVCARLRLPAIASRSGEAGGSVCVGLRLKDLTNSLIN
jgi:hypothetical protein